MNETRIVTVNVMDVSDATLERAPARLMAFLQGAGEEEISRLLVPFGWTKDTLDVGWSLVHDLRHLAIVAPAAPESPVGPAVTACEQWRSAGLVRARALLQISYPEQDAFLFHDFGAATKGTQCVLDVAAFLERRQALEKSGARKASRKADHAALEIIARSGTTRDVVEELELAVRTARTFVASGDPIGPSGSADRRRESLRKIYAWLTAWSDVARTVVTRRDHQIRLGIARRKPRAKPVAAPPPAVVTPPVVVAPPATPPAPSNMADEEAPNSRAA